MKWNFCLTIVIGIVAHLSKFAKKAAPVAATCLVVIMPLTGAVNVASAQEDNSSADIDSEMLLDFTGGYYANIATVSLGDIELYEHLVCILWEARENVQHPSSRYSIVYNNNAFDKYLDSIVSDAQRAGETGVKSFIPTPEGTVLDTITKGAYGEISQINTIAQMGWYMQNISKTSAKMLEETRKGVPQKTIVKEEEPKIFKETREAFDYKLAKTCEDAIDILKIAGVEEYKKEYKIEFFTRLKTYAETHGQGIDPLSGEHFYELDYPLIGITERTVGGGFGNPNPKRSYNVYVSSSYGFGVTVKDVQEQFRRFGYEIPIHHEIVRIPLTEKEKENMLEIKKIAGEYKFIRIGAYEYGGKINELIKKNAGIYSRKGDHGRYYHHHYAPEAMRTAIDQLSDAANYYSSYIIEGNTLITIYQVKKVGLINYFDNSNDFAKYMEYWEENYLEEAAKIASEEDIEKAREILGSYISKDSQNLLKLEIDIRKQMKADENIFSKILRMLTGKRDIPEDVFEDEHIKKALKKMHHDHIISMQYDPIKRSYTGRFIEDHGYENNIPKYRLRLWLIDGEKALYFNNGIKEIIYLPKSEKPVKFIDSHVNEIYHTTAAVKERKGKYFVYVDPEDILRFRNYTEGIN
ncbi:hypothetical protein C5S31_11240 [ANME-1 cluster archaeon GoMg2]|nr:hypothetical protein [ANME-1 cluster archaeon GoMg2]